MTTGNKVAPEAMGMERALEREGEKRMEKLLTISIAAYNAERYVTRALESLILPEEWMKLLEVIVVNDGSTDHTAEIVEKYVLQYPESIKLINKPNGGLGSTYNASSKIAQGKYFRLLDADDWYEKENLPEYLAYLRHTDADLILSPYNKVYGEKGTEERIDQWQFLGEKTRDMAQIPVPAFLPIMHEMTVRTACIGHDGFNVCEHCYYVDNEYVFHCMIHAKIIAYCPQPIYCYLLERDGQSVSLAGARKHYRDLLQISLNVYSYCTKVRLESLSEWAQRIVLNITHITYNIFFLLDQPKVHKKELVAWDKYIFDNFQDIYHFTMRDWKVRLLRWARFSFYSVYCRVKQSRQKSLS